MPEIAAAFKHETGREVKLAFGASGNFSRQIREGAPFELFLSADEANVQFLVDAGRTEGAGRRLRDRAARRCSRPPVAGRGRSPSSRDSPPR